MRASTIDLADEPLSRTLCLCVTTERKNWIFELGPEEERAIVVGSLKRAHIRLDHRGIAPVHFHFERDGASVHLVPAYGRELFANCVRVTGPLELGQRTLLEFSGMRFKVLVSDGRPRHTERVSPAWPVRCSREPFIPEFPDSLSSMEIQEQFTHARSASLLNTVSRTDGVRDGPTLDDLGGTITRSYEPYDPARDLPLPANAQSASRGGVVSEAERESVPLTPHAIISISAPAAATVHLEATTHAPATEEAEACFFGTQDPIMLPTGNTCRHGVDWVERLGILTKRRPILVTAIALVGSLLLALAILALSKVATLANV